MRIKHFHDKPTEHYTPFPNDLIRGASLNLAERSVYLNLLSHRQNWVTSARRIAEELGCSRKTVSKALKTLEEKGLVVVHEDSITTLHKPNQPPSPPKDIEEEEVGKSAPVDGVKVPHSECGAKVPMGKSAPGGGVKVPQGVDKSAPGGGQKCPTKKNREEQIENQVEEQVRPRNVADLPQGQFQPDTPDQGRTVHTRPDTLSTVLTDTSFYDSVPKQEETPEPKPTYTELGPIGTPNPLQRPKPVLTEVGIYGRAPEKPGEVEIDPLFRQALEELAGSLPRRNGIQEES